jgi:butyrate kinase
MKIKMITLYAGPKGVMNAGGTYDVDPALAKQLVDGRYAVKVSDLETTAAPLVDEAAVSSEIETQDVFPDAVETAVKPSPRRGGKDK